MKAIQSTPFVFAYICFCFSLSLSLTLSFSLCVRTGVSNGGKNKISNELAFPGVSAAIVHLKCYMLVIFTIRTMPEKCLISWLKTRFFQFVTKHSFLWWWMNFIIGSFSELMGSVGIENASKWINRFFFFFFFSVCSALQSDGQVFDSENGAGLLENSVSSFCSRAGLS